LSVGSSEILRTSSPDILYSYFRSLKCIISERKFWKFCGLKRHTTHLHFCQIWKFFTSHQRLPEKCATTCWSSLECT